MLRNLISACAAQKPSIPIEGMFSAAVESKLTTFELLVGVPREMRVLLGRHDRPGTHAEARLFRAPNVLVLERAHCEELRLCGITSVSEARFGYISGSDNELRRASLQIADDRLPLFEASTRGAPYLKSWDLWLVGTKTHPLQVRQADVLVSAGTFDSMVKYHNQAPAVPHAWVSKKLDLAFRAADEFWNDSKVKPSERHTHPKEQDVVNWLTAHGVAPTAAKEIWIIIKPEFAMKPGRIEK